MVIFLLLYNLRASKIMGSIDSNMEENINNCIATQIPDQCRVFKRRWLMLLLFCLCSASGSSNWIQYSIISNEVTEYYHVSSTVIEWTYLIFVIVYCPLILPASWMLKNKGLKASIALGACLISAGSLMKAFSAREKYFVIGFIGQTLIGVSQVFILATPTFLAAVWFPRYQVSIATGFGLLGVQIGIGIGFLIPRLFVHEDSKNSDLIGQKLYILTLDGAIFATVIFLLILVFFKTKPPSPPSIAQKLSLATNSCVRQSYRTSLKRLVFNHDFCLLLVNNGILEGTFIAYHTLLKELLVSYFPAAAENAIGFGAFLICGNIVGPLVWSIILDKTQLYKLV